jgi:hypothetical protein
LSGEYEDAGQATRTFYSYCAKAGLQQQSPIERIAQTTELCGKQTVGKYTQASQAFTIQCGAVVLVQVNIYVLSEGHGGV